MSINLAVFGGNLVQDPDFKEINGRPLLKLRVINSEFWKDKSTGEKMERKTAVNVAYWSKRGLWLSQNLSKGSYVVVHGKLTSNTKETPEGRKTFWEIKAENIEFNSAKKRTPEVAKQESMQSMMPLTLDEAMDNIGNLKTQSKYSTDEIPF